MPYQIATLFDFSISHPMSVMALSILVLVASSAIVFRQVVYTGAAYNNPANLS